MWEQRNGGFVLGADLGDFAPESVIVASAGGHAVLLAGGASEDRLPLRTVDLDTGTPLPDRAGLHGWAPPTSVALARCGDRTLLATGTRRGVVRVRDAATGEPIGPEIHHERTGVSVAVARVDGRDVVAVAGGAWIRAWDAADGTQLASRGYRGARFVAYGGRLLAAQRTESTVRQVRDVLTGKVHGTTFTEPASAWTIADVGGRLLVLDGTAAAWDVTAGATVSVPPMPMSAGVREIAVPDGSSTVLTWDDDDFVGHLDVWLPGAAAPRRFPQGSVAAVGGDPLLIASADVNSVLSVSDVATGAPIVSPYYGGEARPPAGVTTLAGRPVTMLPGDAPTVWDIEAGRPVARLDTTSHRIGLGEVDGVPVAALLHPPDGEEPRLRTVDLDTGRVRADVALEPGYASLIPAPVLITRAGRPVVAVVSPAEGRFVRLYDTTTGEPLAESFDLGESVAVLATGLIGDRPVLAAGADLFSAVQVWDTGTGAELLRVQCSGLGLSAIGFGDHDGRPIMATATHRYGTLQTWDAVTGEAVGKPRDVGRYVTPMTITSIQVTRWRNRTVVLTAAKGYPPYLWPVR